MSVTELEELKSHVSAVIDVLSTPPPIDSFLIHAVKTLNQLKTIIEEEQREAARSQVKLL